MELKEHFFILVCFVPFLDSITTFISERNVPLLGNSLNGKH